MKREEAMCLLNNLRSVAEGKEDEAIDMAIDALQQTTWIPIEDLVAIASKYDMYLSISLTPLNEDGEKQSLNETDIRGEEDENNQTEIRDPDTDI